jgi:hypothetical protein
MGCPYMKNKIFYFFVMLELFVCFIQIRRSLATPSTKMVHSFGLGFAQGTCNDGTNTYRFETKRIEQRDSRYATVLRGNNTPIAGLTGFETFHLGDPDYYQGYIYAPLEAAVGNYPLGKTNIDVAIFIATNLTLYSTISISNHQCEASAVCIDPVFSNSVVLFVTSFESVSTNDGIYEYKVNDLTNLTFVKELPLTQNIPHLQGIICVNGMLYAMSDNNSAGDVYQINPTNSVVVHLAQVNVAGQTEWEGLDYFHGHLVANEATTGMVNWLNF